MICGSIASFMWEERDDENSLIELRINRIKTGKMLKYVTPSWGNPTPYSKTLYIFGKQGARKSKGSKQE